MKAVAVSYSLAYFGLGRLKSVCQISSASGSGSCGQDTVSGWPTNGFLTAYSYYATGQVQQIVKNAQSATQQSRSFTYDGIGRVLTEKYPEQNNVATTYVYDSISGYCGTGSYPGNMLQRTDPAGNTMCYYYDSLHRLTDVSGNGQSCKRFRYDNTANAYLGSVPGGVTVSNIKGRLMEAVTDTCAQPPSQSTVITDEWSSYSPRVDLSEFY